MKIVAVAPIGQEFFYSSSTAHAVPVSRAGEIRSILNDCAFRLKEGQTWHLYDVDEYDDAYTVAHCQRFAFRSGKLMEYKC